MAIKLTIISNIVLLLLLILTALKFQSSLHEADESIIENVITQLKQTKELLSDPVSIKII